MPNTPILKRGNRNSSWLVLQRGLAMVRRLMMGPATKAELLAAVKFDVSPSAYAASDAATENAFKNDRRLLAEHLGIQINFDRHHGVYWLGSLGDTPWLSLPADALSAIALIYKTFSRGSPESERIHRFLDLICGLIPPAQMAAIQRFPLSIELREVDEHPIAERVWAVAQRAVAERRRLGFHYRSTADDHVRYCEVEPYEITFRRGHRYLEAYHLLSRGPGQAATAPNHMARFRLQGIVDDEMLVVLPERLPPGPRPQHHYPLRYRLARPAVRHGVSQHFADMQVTREADGSVSVETTVPDPWEAVHILLAYGENCTVLGGDEVLSLMRRRVAAMAKNYDLLVYEQVKE